MLRPITTALTRLLGLCLLAFLGACAQQSQPGYYETPRGSTQSDALHRAQGDAGTAAVAPAQLQLGFGDQEQEKPAASPPAATGTAPAGPAGADHTPDNRPATMPGNADIPKALAETRTYLGTIACMDSGSCAATRMTLTLAPDGQWRARSAPIDGSGPVRTALGCWFLTGSDPVRIVLQTGPQAHASLEFIQSNVLRLTRLNGQTPLLDSRLTRQADVDPIPELAAQPAQACPVH